MRHPQHLISIGRTLIAYEGRDAYIARLAPADSWSVTVWRPSPAHNLTAPCVAFYRLTDCGLAYDFHGTAYIVTTEGATIVDALEWCPRIARERQAIENAERLASFQNLAR